MSNEDILTLNSNVSMHASFQDYIQQIMNAHDIEQFAYFVANKRAINEPQIFSNYPKKWLKVYKERNLHMQDPIINFAFNSIIPFSWSDAILNISAKEKYFLNQAEKYYLNDGYSFTLHDANGNFAALSIGNPRNSEKFSHLINAQKPNLQMLLIEIHHDYLSNYFNLITQNILKDKQITKREKEILIWCSKGKTYNEISIIIGITERTVKFHMANLVKKLNVCNAKHAIFKAHELNLI
ncbi:LuxR family transcriptional regulator [Utexia brackfieldae]|uniref:helix-turn-helix transcriptional regulator n=1 Tax=Utexia brackfieldae TaxID=3074108 RepID=UPI00370D695A